MKIFEIEDIKAFTSHLFVRTSFDTLLVYEVEIATFNTFHIDGHIKKQFFSDEDDIKEEYSSWGDIKGLCYSIIKGTRLPLYFKIILKLPRNEKNEELYVATASDGLYLNIKYENKKLVCVSSVSRSTFDLERKSDVPWDEYIESALKSLQIAYI